MKINHIEILILLFATGLLSSCTKTAKIYYDSGVIKMVAEINSDSLWDGEVRQYYENGVLEYKSTYSNGYIDGLASWYSEEGSLVKTENYINDTLDGSGIFYDSLGNKYLECDFIMGEEIGYRHYDSLGNIIGKFVNLDTFNLPSLSDVQFRFDKDTNDFHVKDTIAADIKIPGISKNQIRVTCSSSRWNINFRKDSFLIDIMPFKSGEMEIQILLLVNEKKMVIIGSKKYLIHE